jgi:hypothetical protein
LDWIVGPGVRAFRARMRRTALPGRCFAAVETSVPAGVRRRPVIANRGAAFRGSISRSTSICKGKQPACRQGVADGSSCRFSSAKKARVMLHGNMAARIRSLR